MFPATSSLVENVDDEISIRNGVISPGNYSLLNGHSSDDSESQQYSYSKKSTVIASNDSKLKLVTPPWATRRTFSDADSSIKRVNTSDNDDIASQNKDLNSSENHLPSKIHPSKLTEKDIWHNYRPSHNGPYTCSFCGQVIHKRSKFSKHLLTCKARLSMGINDAKKMKSLSQKKKQKLHSLLKSCSKMSSKSDDVMERLTRRILFHTTQKKKCDTSNNHVMENSSYEMSDIFASHDDAKDVSSCIESSHKSCLPRTPLKSVCDTSEDFSDIFEDSITPSTSKTKASRDVENERSVSEQKSSESLGEDTDSSVRTLRRTRVREMRTSTDKAKMIRRTSSKKSAKGERMCSPSSKVGEEQFVFVGSDNTSECSRVQINEDKPEDSNLKCDTSNNHVMENSSYEMSDIFASHDDAKDVSSCIESSHKSCLPRTPLKSVCDTSEDFSDIFEDSITPSTSKTKASRDVENERSVSEQKSSESLGEDTDSSVRTLRRTRVREMRTSTDKAKMIRRTSSKKSAKGERMCSPSSKVGEEQFAFVGSDHASECSRVQINEDKPEDSNLKCDTSNNHVMENSSYEMSDIFASHDDAKDVSSCIESSHKSCLPRTPLKSVCDTSEDFSDIFEDSITPSTSKTKASRDVENERSVSEQKSSESLGEDTDSSVRTLRRTRVREMRTSTDKAKMIRRTSSKKLAKGERMCSPSSKVGEEQFAFVGSDHASECSRVQINEDKPEDSNLNESDNSLFRSPSGLNATDKEFSITKSSSPLFRCDSCSVEYGLRRLLSLHMRGKQHKLNAMKNESLMKEPDKCDSEPVGNIIPDVVSDECEKSVLVNPPVSNNNEVVELLETSRHSITGEGDDDDDDEDNETLSKLSEKLKSSSTTPNKNIPNLETGKNLQSEFIESSRIESKDKIASLESKQQKHLSQTPKKSTTVSSTSVFICDTCSFPFRHRGSLLRHQRKTNHRNYDDSDLNPSSRVNNNNIVLVKDDTDSNHCKSQNHKFPEHQMSTINPFVSPQKGITTSMMNEKHPRSDTVVTPFFKIEETVSKVNNHFNTNVIKMEETECLLRASDTTPVDDVTAHSELTSTQSNETVNAQEKPVVDSKNLSSMDDSTIHNTEKSNSICLRRRSMSIQSNEGKKPSSTSKRSSSVKKTTGDSYSLPATPSNDEIVKSRRSSVSTLSSNDNFIDDAKSVISNATTIPASDEMNKDDPELSTTPSCPWCNKSGYSCLRILHIHQSKCPLRPKLIEEQHKSPVSNKEIDKQATTNFTCQECNRGFPTSMGLRVHCAMLKHKHTEQKPVPVDTYSQSLACPGCSRDAPLFDSTEKLLKHLLTLKSGSGNNHTSRSQRWPTVLQVPNLGYGCYICGLLLASESRLDKHKKAVHEAWLLEEQEKISPGKLPKSSSNSS
ncbi:unnamed protein product [Trichobilharzia szidati]|nr:unnamed protein product [Trichobilharzia szidati]